MSKHTPTPWKVAVNSGVSEIHAESRPIARMLLDAIHGSGDHEADINARHIVKCVNLYDELVTFVRDIQDDCLMAETGETENMTREFASRTWDVCQELLAKTKEMK